MNNQCSDSQKNSSSSIDKAKSIWEDDSRERRSLEIKRRFQGLQVRRDHLERELQAVKNCLISLDRQMQDDASYNQLLMRH
tara:strand:- start:338 stop:580 length:243 start_codon:yes stop_codon:yes gene_type:complete